MPFDTRPGLETLDTRPGLEIFGTRLGLEVFGTRPGLPPLPLPGAVLHAGLWIAQHSWSRAGWCLLT